MSEQISFKPGDRVKHKTLGAAVVLGPHHTPFATKELEGYELINIRPDNFFADTHSPTQLVFADACTSL